MYEYRFRAEFRVDMETLMSIFPDAIYDIQRLERHLPDVAVDMTTYLDIAAVKTAISVMPDRIINK